MSLRLDQLNAALAGRYRVEREIGRGGMATVYLANDLRHGRPVAMKFLHPELHIALTGARFRNEIGIVARLQHPNILPLLDSGDVEGTLYYVMPLVDGQTLRQRLSRDGALPIEDVVRILRQVADALAEAHRNGIVHRDVKPENVLLSRRHALVSDFGVAKVVSDAWRMAMPGIVEGDAEAEARQHVEMTAPGRVPGTPTYMAPEQAAGERLQDSRADIYALGVIGYEMLTGRPPFTGRTPAEVLDAHIGRSPEPLSALRDDVPPPLAEAIMRCLAKRPEERFQTAEDFLQQFELMVITPVTPTDVAARPGSVRRRWLWPIGAALVLAVGAIAALQRSRAFRPLTLLGTTRITLESGQEMDPAFSPDGSMIAYAGGSTAFDTIYVRAIAGTGARPLIPPMPCLRPRWPQWTRDASAIVFGCSGAIMSVPVLGGPGRVVFGWTGAGLTSPALSPDGLTLAYVARKPDTRADTLFVRPLAGGTPRAVTVGRDLHSLAWSSDGRLLAYVQGNHAYRYGIEARGNLGASEVYTVPVAGGSPSLVTGRRFMSQSPAFSRDGRSLLLVSNDGGGREVFEIPLDRAGRARGPATKLTTGLLAGSIALSGDGRRLAHTRSTDYGNVWRVLIPARGAVSVREAQPVTTGFQHIETMDVSPDGTTLVFDSDRSGNSDIWTVPLAGGEPTQLTDDPSDDFMPVWSPDGSHIAFHSFRNETRDVFVVPAEGGPARLVAGGPTSEGNPGWGPGGSLVFQSDRTGGSRLYLVDPLGDTAWSEPRQVTERVTVRARWSPDGRMIAFIAGDSIQVMPVDGGEPRTLVRPMDPSGRRVIPRDVAWARDGESVLFKAWDVFSQASIWSVPAGGGVPRLLVRFDDPTRPSDRWEFATDGTWVYFTINDRQSDIHVIEVAERR